MASELVAGQALICPNIRMTRYPMPAFIDDVNNCQFSTAVVVLMKKLRREILHGPTRHWGIEPRLANTAPPTSDAPPDAYSNGLNFSDWLRTGGAALLIAFWTKLWPAERCRSMRVRSEMLGHLILTKTIAIWLAILVIAPAVAAANEVLPPPDSNRAMNLSEIQYCLNQDTRLSGVRSAIDSAVAREIDAFNALVEDWNSRCSSYRYREADRATADAENAGMRTQLESEGRRLVDEWRSAFRATQFHVDSFGKADVALRSGPGQEYRVVHTLKNFDDLLATGSARDGWIPVARRSGSTSAIHGFVLLEEVKPGPGVTARRAHCASIAGPSPYNGEVFGEARGGPHSVVVINGRSQDAFVKIVGPHRVEVAFFVEGKNRAEVTGLRNGSYMIAFATGMGFSRGCGTFLDDSTAQAFDRREHFATTASVVAETLELTLHPVVGGQASTHEITMDEFGSL